MHENWVRFKAAVSFELDSDYAFPLFERAFALITLLSFYFALLPNLGWDLVVVPSQWNGTYFVDAYTEVIPLMATISLGGCMFQFSQIFAVAMPILISLSVARELESGMMRTKLSYPIGRNSLLLTKCLLVASITVIPASLMSLGGVLLFEPGPKDIGALVIHFVSLWLSSAMVISIALLASLVSKGLPGALFSGLAVSFGLTQLPLLVPGWPLWIDSFCNPAHGAVRLLDWIRTSQESMLELAAGFGLAIALVTVLLVLSISVFRKMEV